MKIVAIGLLIAVLASLFYGLYCMMRDRGNRKRMANALTVRIGLSIVAFILALILLANRG